MSKHVHADLMMQYAQDAMETDNPNERWEFFNKHFCRWEPVGQWAPCWDEEEQYRRKPQSRYLGVYACPQFDSVQPAWLDRIPNLGNKMLVCYLEDKQDGTPYIFHQKEG